MGYLRKALSISTLGLSNLVLDEESKPPVTSATKGSATRKRAKAKPKAKARAKATASAPAGKRTLARGKARPARAKANATSAKAKPAQATAKAAGATTSARRRTAVKRPTATRSASTRTGSTRTAATRAAAKPRRATRAKPLTPQRPVAQAAPTAQAATPAQVTTPAPAVAQAPGAATAARPGAPTSGVAIALDRIAKLHKHGALSEREFEAAKARILGTSPPPAAPEPASATFPAIEANVAAARRLDGYVNPDREAAGTRPGAPGSDF